MIRTSQLAATTVIVLLCGMSTLAVDRGSGNFDLSWHTIDCGGGTSTGDAFSLTGTIGQPDAGTLTGGSFELSGGFWAGGVIQNCPADLSGDGNINVTDLFQLLANWNTAGPGADLAPPNDIVNVSDLFALLAAWGVCD